MQCRGLDPRLIASPKAASGTEVTGIDRSPLVHDAYPHLLGHLDLQPEILWQEVANLLQFDSGCLVVDDTTIDKPYGPYIKVVPPHWSGHSTVL